MANIWVVEQGSYSDYGVVGVFSTPENAQLIADRINASDPYEKATVATWDIDPAIEAIRQGCHPFLVRMQFDGHVDSVEQNEPDRYEITGSVRLYPWEGRLRLCANVWATDVQHAVKIANEYRMRMIVDNTWKAPNGQA